MNLLAPLKWLFDTARENFHAKPHNGEPKEYPQADCVEETQGNWAGIRSVLGHPSERKEPSGSNGPSTLH